MTVGLLRKNQCFYVFDSHSKNGNGNISTAGIAVKFESLSLPENYTRTVYYAN